jgi:hypothetical protein
MSLQNVMSKREKPGWQIIDHFFTKAVPTMHLPDDPDKQCTVDQDASSEEYSNVALPQLKDQRPVALTAHPNN